MNYSMVFRIVGRISGMLAVILLIPSSVSLIYKESIRGFAAAILIAAALCVFCYFITRNKTIRMFSKEGFASVALSWIVLSFIGAVPFVVEGAIPNYVDALFETISGFTTTGASILEDVESMSRGLLFWRSFTHWIGGMGILVLMMAVLPTSEQYSMYIMRAEVPGHEAGKLVPKVQNSSLILYLIYVFLTLLEIVLLLFGNMPLFDAVVHAFGTAGTGGFGIKAASIGAYNSAYIDVVISVFMLLFGTNFNLYFLLLLKKAGAVIRNEEFRLYILIVAASTLLIAVNITSLYDDFITALRYSFFQVSSIITTTGFATADFNLWPQFSKVLLVLLMMIGACSGSTAGGIKVSRVLILLRAGNSEIKHMLRPNSYSSVQLNGKRVDRRVIHGVLVFFLLYMLITLGSALALSLENYDAETIFTSVIACISNVGPGLGLAGPVENFAFYSDASKLLLSLCMLMGRLEIFPILMLFSPNTWKRSSRF